MGNISDAFQDALADQARSALAEVVAKNPSTTVKELRQLVSLAPQLGSMTLDDLLGAGSKGRRGGRRKGAGGRGRKGESTVKRDVRRKSGRDQLDIEVLDALSQCGGESVAARQLRDILHTDPTQLRTSLNRLINAGKVTFSGKARGTRYSLV